MARVSVEVPAELVGRVRETVLLLYEATAESLHLALRAHSEGRGSPRELHEPPRAPGAARRAARAARLAGRPRRRLELAARPSCCTTRFYGALIDAGERLAVTASSAWRGEQPLERVQEAAAEVLAAPQAAAPAGVAHMTAGSSPCR